MAVVQSSLPDWDHEENCLLHNYIFRILVLMEVSLDSVNKHDSNQFTTDESKLLLFEIHPQ
jgi:hypothetical protein